MVMIKNHIIFYLINMESIKINFAEQIDYMIYG